MKINEIGPHDHGVSGKFIEQIIDASGRSGDIIAFSENEAEVVEHVMDHHLGNSIEFKIERVFTGEPNPTIFIFSKDGVDSIPLVMTDVEELEDSLW